MVPELRSTYPLLTFCLISPYILPTFHLQPGGGDVTAGTRLPLVRWWRPVPGYLPRS